MTGPGSVFVAQARDFARLAHWNQKYGDEPYTVHTDAVVAVLEEYSFVRVAYLVTGVTNESGGNRRERNAATYPKIRSNADCVALKLADRIANARHAKETGSSLLEMYRREYPDFRAALWREGEFGGMWGELDYLMLPERERSA